MDMKKLLVKLRNQRSDIMMTLTEDKSIHNPQVIVSLVYELRTLTDMINMITEAKVKDKDRAYS